MAEKRRFIDVWLVEPNTVYREVPYNVVTDWVSQSRLVADDMIRPSGTAQWFRVGDSPEFSPFMPKAEPVRIEDEATALEPVDMGFHWKRPSDDEDDDCDMIPLIDVSLVLLIFFMLTSAAVVAAALIKTPATVNGLVGDREKMYWINVGLVEKTDEVTLQTSRVPRFSVSAGDKNPEPLDDDLVNISETIGRLKAVIGKNTGVEVTIGAHEDVESGVVRKLTVELTKLGVNTKIVNKKFIAVSEKGS